MGIKHCQNGSLRLLGESWTLAELVNAPSSFFGLTPSNMESALINVGPLDSAVNLKIVLINCFETTLSYIFTHTLKLYMPPLDVIKGMKICDVLFL